MAIPFPPDGPQVQAALQKVPTPQLQQYAAGRPPQPTGQVTPGPMGAAATALNERSAMGAANQRQMAMQNNPQNSPTVFQQKDMELQQKAQQLAAMQQQMQQKEQQLGVAGALMAKKAQDLQAREAMGVAQLPVNPNMFTAMDGGIVFNRGGNVEGYASDGLVKDRGILTTEGLAADFKRLFDYLGVPWTSFEEGMARTKEGQEALRQRVASFNEVPLTGSRAEDKKAAAPASTPTPTRSPTTPKPPATMGVASLPVSGSRADEMLAKIGEVGKVDRSRSKDLLENYLANVEEIKKAVASGEMSEAEGNRLMQAHMAERAKIQEAYTKDRGARQEEIRKAMEGEKPSIWKGIAAGLPTDLRGMRLAGGIASIAKGVAGQEAEYDKRRREAAVEDAKTKQLFAQADKEFALGNIEAGNKFRKEAEDRLLRTSQIKTTALKEVGAGIGKQIEQANVGESEEAAALRQMLSTRGQVVTADDARRSQEAIAQAQLQNQRAIAEFNVANREANPQNRLINMLLSEDPRQQKTAMAVLGKGRDEVPSAVQVELTKQIGRKYENPHDPRVIAAVEKISPEAAKILRLKPEQAKNQPNYSDALGIVERLQLSELMQALGKPTSYTALPSPK